METSLFAQLTLLSYAIAGIAVVLWQTLRCDAGWRAWFLYFIDRTYAPLAFHWRSNRRCPFPSRGPALIIANHRSPVDPLLVWQNHHLSSSTGRIRVIGFITAREFCDAGGFVGFVCRTMESIPADRDGEDVASARKALRRLKNGELVGIFPEGRINEGTDLLKANSGIAWLALRAKVPVFPVFIHGAPQADSMVKPFLTFQRVRVSYGLPVDLSGYYDRKMSRELLDEVTDLLMQRLAELGQVGYATAGEERDQHS